MIIILVCIIDMHDNHFILYNIIVCTEQMNIVECEVEHGIFIYII